MIKYKAIYLKTLTKYEILPQTLKHFIVSLKHHGIYNS